MTARKGFLISFFLAALLILGAGASVAGQAEEHHRSCEWAQTTDRVADVHYWVGVREHDAASPPALLLQLSIAPEQAGSEGALVRLGCQLAADFPAETTIQALVFDDKDAARRLALNAQDQPRHGIYLWHLRARYELNRNKKRQLLDFLIPIVDDNFLGLKRFRVSIDF